MEQFEGFEKLKNMKNENGMEWEKWVNQTKCYYYFQSENSTLIQNNRKFTFALTIDIFSDDIFIF